jgi:hypothetical protein
MKGHQASDRRLGMEQLEGRDLPSGWWSCAFQLNIPAAAACYARQVVDSGSRYVVQRVLGPGTYCPPAPSFLPTAFIPAYHALSCAPPVR